jgi:small conductance mechanosensitive channel
MIDLLALYSQHGMLVRAILILLVGILVAKISSVILGKMATGHFGEHIGRVTRNTIFYVLITVALITFLGVFEIELTGILAAAGILGIAIGFAAQTSVSNIISGFFIIVDRPFEIGDAIELDGHSGVILDISLLSTRIRTFDNRYLRLPNSTVANAKIVNFSKYEVRRLDLTVGIAYKEDIPRALDVIDRVVRSNVQVLLEPEPVILVTRFGDSSVDLEIRAWVERAVLFTVRSELIMGIKGAFDEAGIEIPYPHRKLFVSDERATEGRSRT